MRAIQDNNRLNTIYRRLRLCTSINPPPYIAVLEFREIEPLSSILETPSPVVVELEAAGKMLEDERRPEQRVWTVARRFAGCSSSGGNR